MKQELSLLTSFALNELDGPESQEVASMLDGDASARAEVADIRKMARLIEQALGEEAMPAIARSGKAARWWIGSAAAAAAAILMVFAFPHINHKNGVGEVSVEE